MDKKWSGSADNIWNSHCSRYIIIPVYFILRLSVHWSGVVCLNIANLCSSSCYAVGLWTSNHDKECLALCLSNTNDPWHIVCEIHLERSWLLTVILSIGNNGALRQNCQERMKPYSMSASFNFSFYLVPCAKCNQQPVGENILRVAVLGSTHQIAIH